MKKLFFAFLKAYNSGMQFEAVNSPLLSELLRNSQHQKKEHQKISDYLFTHLSFLLKNKEWVWTLKAEPAGSPISLSTLLLSFLL